MSTLRNLFECLKLSIQILIQLQNRSYISAPVKIIWCTPNSNQNISLKPILITLLNQLVSPDHQIQPIDLIELLNHSLSKQPASPSIRHNPSVNIVRIRPHQITIRSFMGNLNISLYSPNLIDGSDMGTQSSMDAKNLLINNCSQRKVIKNIIKHFPWTLISIFLSDFIKESINHGNLS